MDDAYTFHLRQLLKSQNHKNSEAAGSIKSVPVSEIAHKQTSGTCYAHACATAIRAAEARIVGRKLQSHDSLTEEIIKKYGTDGGHSETVLNDFCRKKGLGYGKKVGVDNVLKCLEAGRVVVASFDLPEYHWMMFSAFFRENPKGVLTKKQFDLDARRATDFPPELRKEEGHTVVISGFHRAAGGTLVFKMKNSWGPSFADGGSFLVECDAAPFIDFLDVFFCVEDLNSSDIRNFLLDCLKLKEECDDRVYFDTCIKVPGYSSKFDIVTDDATLSCNDVSSQGNDEDEKAVSQIHDLLRQNASIEIDLNGIITLDGSKHKFRVLKTNQSSTLKSSLRGEKRGL